MQQVSVIGIDTSKLTFHALTAYCDKLNKPKREKLSAQQMRTRFANEPSTMIVMEACGGSHYWANILRKQGHDARLIAPQHVTPFRRGNKNDYNDAMAITEAALRDEMRFVRVKTVEQLQVQGLERMRDLVVKQRTEVTNQIRGLLAEQGIVIPRGINVLQQRIADILEDPDNGLIDMFRSWLHNVWQRLIQLNKDIKFFTEQENICADRDERCTLLRTIPGIGPISSLAMSHYVGDPDDFKRGRDVSASLGIVPRQNTTGGKPTLGGISKRGNSRLRYLLIHGARSVARHADKKTDSLSRWFCQLRDRRGYNKAVVALANKIARIAWAVLKTHQPYKTNFNNPALNS